jgi:hypothetical protein
MHSILPFLLLGIGIDDMFVIMQSFTNIIKVIILLFSCHCFFTHLKSIFCAEVFTVTFFEKDSGFGWKLEDFEFRAELTVRKTRNRLA